VTASLVIDRVSMDHAHEHPHDQEWTDGSIFGPYQVCFGCGPKHPFGLRLKFKREGDEVITNFSPNENHQGMPTMMHGGLMTTLADELGGWALIMLVGKLGFTGSMKCRFPRAIKIGTPIEGRAKIIRESTRMPTVGIRILQDGEACFTAEMNFLIPDKATAFKMFGSSLMPDGWEKYFR
jgi:acyl-coenzyme A thioesterase PaaI-like protein